MCLEAVGFSQIAQPQGGLQRCILLDGLHHAIELFTRQIHFMVSESVLERLGLKNSKASQKKKRNTETPGSGAPDECGLEVALQDGLQEPFANGEKTNP